MTTAPFADFLNAANTSFDAIARACTGYVANRAGNLAPDEMYADLLYNARSAAEVDQMLYQLEGDWQHAEHAALLVLSAAWNDPAQVEAVKQAFAGGEPGDSVDLRDLGISVLYGMYLLARSGGPNLREVTYRSPEGKIVAAPTDAPLTSEALFNAVRDQYAAIA